MRQIVLDTETTGLNARLGDRVIEIAGVELVSRRLSGNHFHRYLNPERDVEEGALRVHGITNEFLQDKPRFADIARELLEYVRGAELVIHNAAFDVEFLNIELEKLGLDRIESHVARVIDTLATARELHPGKRNSLDALCERYQIDNSHRTLHGALLDAELLAVYLEEAGEVLATIDEHLGKAREHPQDIELLRTIRRGFHTLKGSGRMVGLTRLGEASFAVEQVLNRWLEEERVGTPDLFTLVDVARQFFAGAVTLLKAGAASPDESQIVALSQKVKAGEPLGEVKLEAPKPARAPAAPKPAAPAPRAAAKPAAPAEAPAIAFPEIDLTKLVSPAKPTTVTAPPAGAPMGLAPAAPARPAAPADEELVVVGRVGRPHGTDGAFVVETALPHAWIPPGQADYVRAELVEQQEGIEVVELRCADHPAETYAGAVGRRLPGHDLDDTPFTHRRHHY